MAPDVDVHACTFSIVLHSTDDVLTRSLCLTSFPETVWELQGHIETEFNVPRCCQSVVFEGVSLLGNDSLRVHRARSGDSFHVYYNSEADVTDIRGVVKCMEDAYILIEKSYNDEHSEYYIPNREFNRESVLDTIQLLDQRIKPETIECLATQYFQPFKSKRAIANRLFFLDLGSLELLHKLHVLVVKYPWDVTVIALQHLEQAILRVLWNISASFDVRLQVLRHKFLELCMKSALRVPIQSNARVKAPKHLAFGTNPTPDLVEESILGENMYKAFGVIFNLAELPECQVRIASEPGLLRQAVMIALSPSYKYIASLVTVAGLVCLAYNPDTHQYLVQDDILQQVRQASMIRRVHRNTEQEEFEHRTLFRYFVALFYAQVVASSIHLIPKALLPGVCQLMSDVLMGTDPRELHNYEEKNGYFWSTVRPHINLAYCPLSARKNLSTVDIVFSTKFCNLEPEDMAYPCVRMPNGQLLCTVPVQELCAEIGILSLENMIRGEETRRVLQDEHLVDFIVCMPWSLEPVASPPHLKSSKLVKTLGELMKLEPPSLINIARAKLATDTFGLQKTIDACTIHDLIS